MLFTGSGESFNVGAALESISPYAWASTGIALCIGLSVVGAAWYVPRYEDVALNLHSNLTQRCLGASSSQAPPFSVEVSRHRVSEQRTSSPLSSARLSPSMVSSWPSSSRPRSARCRAPRCSLPTLTTLVLPSSGLASPSVVATWSVVSLSVSMAVVRHLLMQRIRHCMITCAPRPTSVENPQC